ncbi:hypothetical protein JOB18_021469 [Solea senegalensis]|uniref:Uncharacterized protein n=1 Tax=Solea senegalensis TaxID=28829 RepID=A0AAV6QUE1_SOLSE|nr:hypothetical protein JOB18_021469 [Solea senegalensis]
MMKCDLDNRQFVRLSSVYLEYFHGSQGEKRQGCMGSCDGKVGQRSSALRWRAP